MNDFAVFFAILASLFGGMLISAVASQHWGSAPDGTVISFAVSTGIALLMLIAHLTVLA